MTAYNEGHVTVVPGLEAVRKRPGMYIGNTGIEGFHQLVYEIIDNSVDESFAGVCNSIHVQVQTTPEGPLVEVIDNGRGIPVGMHPTDHKPTVETVLTTLHAGAKFDSKAYKISGGLHGVGLSVVNALSKWIEVDVHRSGSIWRIRCERSKPTSYTIDTCGFRKQDFSTILTTSDEIQKSGISIRRIGSSDLIGTTIRFIPDLELFDVLEYDEQILKKRLSELQYLVPKLRFTLDFNSSCSEFYSKNGIIDLLQTMSDAPRTTPIEVFREAQLDDEYTAIKVVYMFTSSMTESSMSFANGINTRDGGTHVAVFNLAFAKALSKFASERSLKLVDGVFDEVRNSLAFVVELQISNPQFESQTKVKLKNQSLQGVFLKDLTDAIFFELSKDSINTLEILKESIQISEKRNKFQDSLNRIRKKRKTVDRNLPLKLVDCSSKKFEDREIFIVEGDSAGGSLKQCVDSERQAILPLRGKTRNSENFDLDELLESEALITIEAALGLDFDKSDYKKLRYARVIIMTDADSDGSHIICLLANFFYRYHRPLLESGRLYVAMPPLFRVRHGKTSTYARDSKDLDRILKSLSKRDRDNAVIQRFKGLGEMNPEQLWETCIDPAARRLQKLTIFDAEAITKVVNATFGTSADKKREFIHTHAHEIDASFSMDV